MQRTDTLMRCRAIQLGARSAWRRLGRPLRGWAQVSDCCALRYGSAAGLTFIKGDPVAIPSRAGPMVVEFWATW